METIEEQEFGLNYVFTNAERIRTMSDEDLAEWLGYICDSWYEPKGGWLAWLRKEVEG